MTQDTASPDKTRKKILTVYGLLGASLVVSFIPKMAFAYLAMFLFVATLLAAYIYRAEDKAEGLLSQHMTWIVRTVWIASLFALPTIGLAIAYMIPQIDYSLMNACVQEVSAQLDPDNPDYAALDAMIQPCMDDFLHHNQIVFFIAMLIGGGPLVLYMVLRGYRGLSAFRAGRDIPNLKGWF